MSERHRTQQSRVPRSTLLLGCVGLATALLFMGCLPEAAILPTVEPAGFFRGIWHGWIAPISLIVSIFDDSVSIFQPINTGFWYEFGFYMAIVGGFGGLSLARKKRSKHDRD